MIIPLSAAYAEGGEILDGRWLCSDIEENVTEDTPAKLKDDFALYVNKPWILEAEIPEGALMATALAENGILVKERKMALMKDDSLTGHDAAIPFVSE